jgi:antagonist of KipI
MTPAFDVRDGGLLTTVQDVGRPHAMASGVPPGGAMDLFAHSAANLLVSNERAAATLECTLTGPRLVAMRPVVVAVAGADFELLINDAPAPTWVAISLAAGDELRLGPRRAGARAYIAVAGGVAGDRWLGSLSTNLMAARGGLQGRPLKAGDTISIGDARPDAIPVPGRGLAERMRPRYADHTLLVIAGPHANRLTAESRDALYTSSFALGTSSNRMGYRLEGPDMRMSGDEPLSFGLVAGALQVTSGGRAILLMADHQTAGGYPVVATVSTASMPVAAQLAPGDEVQFAETSIEAALELRAAQRSALDSLRS